MKKFVTLALALVLVSALAVTAFAAALDADTTDASFAVTATYSAFVEAEDVVSAAVTWTNTEFAYAAGSRGEWNADPEVLAYENAGAATWTGTLNIAVANYSNIDLDVSADFASAEDIDVEMAFVGAGTVDNALSGTAGALTITGTVSGEIDGPCTLGTVTVAIANVLQ